MRPEIELPLTAQADDNFINSMLLGFGSPLIVVLSSFWWKVHEDFWAVHSEEIIVRGSTQLGLYIREYLKTPAFEMLEQK